MYGALGDFTKVRRVALNCWTLRSNIKTSFCVEKGCCICCSLVREDFKYIRVGGALWALSWWGGLLVCVWVLAYIWDRNTLGLTSHLCQVVAEHGQKHWKTSKWTLTHDTTVVVGSFWPAAHTAAAGRLLLYRTRSWKCVLIRW